MIDLHTGFFGSPQHDDDINLLSAAAVDVPDSQDTLFHQALLNVSTAYTNSVDPVVKKLLYEEVVMLSSNFATNEDQVQEESHHGESAIDAFGGLDHIIYESPSLRNDLSSLSSSLSE